MNNHFAMDHNILKQLSIIKSLENRSETTVRSLYAQAIIEYTLYEHEKKRLLELIDQTLLEKNKEAFDQYAVEYNELIDNHRHGKKIIENGFELNITFEE